MEDLFREETYERELVDKMQSRQWQHHIVQRSETDVVETLQRPPDKAAEEGESPPEASTSAAPYQPPLVLPPLERADLHWWPHTTALNDRLVAYGRSRDSHNVVQNSVMALEARLSRTEALVTNTRLKAKSPHYLNKELAPSSDVMFMGRRRLILFQEEQARGELTEEEQSRRQDLYEMVKSFYNSIRAQVCRRRLFQRYLHRNLRSDPRVVQYKAALLQHVGRGYVWRMRLCAVWRVRGEVKALMSAEEEDRRAAVRYARATLLALYHYFLSGDMDSTAVFIADLADLGEEPEPEAPQEDADPNDDGDNSDNGKRRATRRPGGKVAQLRSTFGSSRESLHSSPSKNSSSTSSPTPPHHQHQGTVIPVPRTNAAIQIQRYYRGYHTRQAFNHGDGKARLAWVKHKILDDKHKRWLFCGEEAAARRGIEHQWTTSSPAHPRAFRHFVIDQRRLNYCAARIQAVYRGHYVRTYVYYPMLTEALNARVSWLRHYRREGEVYEGEGRRSSVRRSIDRLGSLLAKEAKE